jgi:hypothetical protein
MGFSYRAWTRRAAIAVLALFCLATGADAASRVCRQLEAELAPAGSGGSSAQARKYDAAIARQTEQLRIARRQARSAGCGSSIFGGGSCGTYSAHVAKMERNLDMLRERRAGMGGAGNPRRDRARILAALDARGCRAAAPEERREASIERRPRTPVERIVAEPVPRGLPRERQLPPAPEGASPLLRILQPDGSITVSGPPGTFRTLCVRTCDGYFFPMSPASSALDFGRDQTNCESACPGTDMQLYYHRLRGEDTASMTSAAGGEPYSALPTAYRYKAPGARRPAGCGCGAAAQGANFSVVSGPPLPSPAPRDDADSPAATDGTASIASSNSIVEIVQKPAAETPKPAIKAAGAAPDPAAERPVRVVGPAFLPDPEAAIDLRAPDQPASP